MISTLNNLKIGEEGVVVSLNSGGRLYTRLMDIGLVEGTKIKCVMQSPFGDPKAYLIRGAVIAIRQEDGADIVLEKNGGEVKSNGTYPKIGGNGSLGR